MCLRVRAWVYVCMCVSELFMFIGTGNGELLKVVNQ